MLVGVCAPHLIRFKGPAEAAPNSPRVPRPHAIRSTPAYSRGHPHADPHALARDTPRQKSLKRPGASSVYLIVF